MDHLDARLAALESRLGRLESLLGSLESKIGGSADHLADAKRSIQAWVTEYVSMRLQQLDGWLATRQYIATDDFTVADLLMTHVLAAAANQGLLKPYPNILAYRARCTERPAWKRTLEAYEARVEAA